MTTIIDQFDDINLSWFDGDQEKTHDEFFIQIFPLLSRTNGMKREMKWVK